MSTAYNTRHLSRGERRARREAVEVEFDEGSLRDAKTWDEGFLEVEKHRPLFNALNVADQKTLDELLGRVDVKSVLGTLAQLCEARAPSEYDLDTDFSDHADAEIWTDRANALYQTIERVK